MRARPSNGVLGIIRWNDGSRRQGLQQQNAYYRLVGNLSLGPSRSAEQLAISFSLRGPSRMPVSSHCFRIVQRCHDTAQRRWSVRKQHVVWRI
jgi:hypothetical protein